MKKIEEIRKKFSKTDERYQITDLSESLNSTNHKYKENSILTCPHQTAE